MVLKVYGHLSSGNCYKVWLALKQLGRPFEWVDVDAVKQETRHPEFLAKNPAGKVPLLELEPGRYLSESNAILTYLVDGTPLLPVDPWLRAQAMQWLFWEQYSHEPYIATSRYVRHLLGNPPSRQGDLERWRSGGLAALALMDAHLEKRAFFVAETYGVADIALYAYTHVAPEGGFDLGRYANIHRWMERVRGQPGHAPMATPTPALAAEAPKRMSSPRVLELNLLPPEPFESASSVAASASPRS